MDRLTPSQIRGARGMLGWSMTDLSRAARVSVSTVKRIEGGGPAAASTAMLDLMRDAFEAAGVRFLADDGDGPGLRVSPRRASPFSRLS